MADWFGVAMFAEFVRLVEQYSAEFDAFAVSVGEWLSSVGFTAAQATTVESTLSADDIIAAVSGLLGGAISIAGWAIVLITALTHATPPHATMAAAHRGLHADPRSGARHAPTDAIERKRVMRLLTGRPEAQS